MNYREIEIELMKLHTEILETPCADIVANRAAQLKIVELMTWICSNLRYADEKAFNDWADS